MPSPFFVFFMKTDRQTDTGITPLPHEATVQSCGLWPEQGRNSNVEALRDRELDISVCD